MKEGFYFPEYDWNDIILCIFIGGWGGGSLGSAYDSVILIYLV